MTVRHFRCYLVCPSSHNKNYILYRPEEKVHSLETLRTQQSCNDAHCLPCPNFLFPLLHALVPLQLWEKGP